MNPEAEWVSSIALPGAMDHGNGWVTFSIYAPGKRSVHLQAGFNGWEWRQHPLTERAPGYWVTARQLEPGVHAYRFVLDEVTVVCDPYAQSIRPADDPAEPPHARVHVGRPIYRWRHAHVQRPSLTGELIVYEMHIGDFSPEGTFGGVTDRLDYLEELGVNAIEFMPWYEAAPHDYWGYEPAFYFAPRAAYGTAEELMAMVDEAHGRGMVVILDIVLAHTAHEHPFNRMYPYEQSPWYGRSTGEPNQFGLPVIDYSKPPANGFVRDVLAYWMGVFRVDGFRFDYIAGIGSDDQGRGLPYLMHVAREIRPQAFFIGECLPENPGLVNPSGLSAVWHTRSRLALQALLLEGETTPYDWNRFADAVRAFDPATQDYARAEFMVNYVESHDDPRLFTSLRAAGFDPATAARKCMLAASILMTIPGEPMVFHGQEWGEDAPTERRLNRIDWARAASELHEPVLVHTRRMCRLRRARPSLRGPHYAVAVLDEGRRILAFHRRQGQADQAVVAVNFSGERHELAIPFPQPGPWHEAFSEEIVHVRQDVRRTLEPYSATVFLSGVS